MPLALSRLPSSVYFPLASVLPTPPEPGERAPVVAPLVEAAAPDGRVDTHVHPAAVAPGATRAVGPGSAVVVGRRLFANHECIAGAVRHVGQAGGAVFPEHASLVGG